MTHTSNFRRWSSDEDARLQALVARDNATLEQLTDQCPGRTPAAVAARLQRLGLHAAVDLSDFRRTRRRGRPSVSNTARREWTRWSDDEDAVLRVAAVNRADFADLPPRLPHRSPTAIGARLRVLGLADRISGSKPHGAKANTASPRRPSARRRRACLTCRESFRSAGPHNRLCDACRERIADLSPYAF